MKNRMFGGIGAMALVEDDGQIPGTIDRATGRLQSADLSDSEVDDMRDDPAETVLRMKGEVVIVPAEPMPSATAPAEGILVLTPPLRHLKQSTGDETTALHVERDGKTFYFCSDHCRQKFLSVSPGAKPEGRSGGCCG